MEHSLPQAFMAWLDGQRDLLDEIEVEQSRYAALIRFQRFPELRGYLRGAMLTVEAMRNEISWDCVFMRDVAPVQSAQGWSCRECPKSVFATPEALYADHLFEPFREWVLGPLRVTSQIDFIDVDGMTFAKLHPGSYRP